MVQQPLTKLQLKHHIKTRMAHLIQDESGSEPAGIAIYTLADPRDARAVRYVGLSAAPMRRYVQHLNVARLWLPDEMPPDEMLWWIRSPQLRPLYEWIRELHRDDYRLPVMVIAEWCGSLAEARGRERQRIYDYLIREFSLLNVEAEINQQRILV